MEGTVQKLFTTCRGKKKRTKHEKKDNVTYEVKVKDM